MVQRVSERHDPPEGQPAEIDRFARLRAIFCEGSREIVKARRFSLEKRGEIWSQDLCALWHLRNGFAPARRLMAGAVKKYFRHLVLLSQNTLVQNRQPTTSPITRSQFCQLICESSSSLNPARRNASINAGVWRASSSPGTFGLPPSL